MHEELQCVIFPWFKAVEYNIIDYEYMHAYSTANDAHRTLLGCSCGCYGLYTCTVSCKIDHAFSKDVWLNIFLKYSSSNTPRNNLTWRIESHISYSEAVDYTTVHMHIDNRDELVSVRVEAIGHSRPACHPGYRSE